MTHPAFLSLFLAAFLVAMAPLAPAREREMPYTQARQIALLVAAHDHITVDDRNVVLNSMDTRTPEGFLRGYYSFSIIREGSSAAEADDTIRMYAISKRTGETWEMNLCNRYNFPALEKMQKSVMRETGSNLVEDPGMPKDIGCAAAVQAAAHPDTAPAPSDAASPQ